MVKKISKKETEKASMMGMADEMIQKVFERGHGDRLLMAAMNFGKEEGLKKGFGIGFFTGVILVAVIALLIAI